MSVIKLQILHSLPPSPRHVDCGDLLPSTDLKRRPRQRKGESPSIYTIYTKYHNNNNNIRIMQG
jgi:hypothetical protein